jgi:dipeptidyl aminopeptidase/acylaminoacyl peptidase/predicted Ser/Thr protein kinase
MIGRTIDRYDVVERLGEGGMGVVYKARDTLLDRFVALKVLPPDKSREPERRQRFLGEAKAASALNHPGIVAVHDVLTVDGQDLIVMELVEGETLEARLARKPLPPGEALGLAIQIADALGRAHAAGIVHRDLKPANVMVTRDGGVKILDFGLAKLTQAPFLDSEAPTVSRHEDLTAEPAIVGTVAWMSPEQAEGRPVDARSDIFAFGLVLYEMLTGKHPFRRGTLTRTLASLREDDPEPPRSLVPALPLEAERAVLRCLRKDPGRRWQSVADLGAVLEDVKEDSESGRKTPSAGGPVRSRWALAAGAGALLVAIAAGVALLSPREPAAPPPLELRRLTYDAGLNWLPAISPDGNLVAYSSDRSGEGHLDIWVRHINRSEPTRLTRHPAHEWGPRFSPDGSQLVFRSERDGGGIYVVGALGGQVRRVAGRGFFPSFSPDGASLVYTENPDHASGVLLRMFRVPAEGGFPEPFVPGFGTRRPPAGGVGPVWSPDGQLVMFSGAPLDAPRERDWWVAPVAGGEPRSSGANEVLPPLEPVRFPSLWRPGRLLVTAGTTIEGMNVFQLPVTDEGRVSGPPRPLTAGPGMTWSPSVATDGRLVLSRFHWVVHLWEQTLDGATGRGVGAPRRLTSDTAPKFGLSLARYARRLAFSTYSGSSGDRRAEIHVLDPAKHPTVAVSRPATTTNLYPCLSSDAAWLAWAEIVESERRCFVAPTGEPAAREVCRGGVPVSFLAGASELLVDRGHALGRIRLADGTETPVFELKDRWLLAAALSPDEEWLAVLTNEPGGGRRLRIRPLAGARRSPEEWIAVAGGDEWVGPPAWGAGARHLYYLSGRDDFVCVWGRRLDPATKAPEGDPFPVAHAHTTAMSMQMPTRAPWTLTSDGDRLVFNSGEASGDIYTAMLPE